MLWDCRMCRVAQPVRSPPSSCDGSAIPDPFCNSVVCCMTVEAVRMCPQDPANVVVIFSGSETSKLDEIFGHLPVWLAAENGVYVRPPAKGGAGGGAAAGGGGGGGEGGPGGQRGTHASGGSPPGGGHGSQHQQQQHGQGQQQQQQQVGAGMGSGVSPPCMLKHGMLGRTAHHAYRFCTRLPPPCATSPRFTRTLAPDRQPLSGLGSPGPKLPYAFSMTPFLHTPHPYPRPRIAPRRARSGSACPTRCTATG